MENTQLPSSNSVQPPLKPSNPMPAVPPVPASTPAQPVQSVKTAENPYLDQQVLPGQVIGYGLPTDQHVFGQPPVQPSSKKKPVLIAGIVAAVLIIVAAVAVSVIS